MCVCECVWQNWKWMASFRQMRVDFSGFPSTVTRSYNYSKGMPASNQLTHSPRHVECRVKSPPIYRFEILHVQFVTFIKSNSEAIFQRNKQQKKKKNFSFSPSVLCRWRRFKANKSISKEKKMSKTLFETIKNFVEKSTPDIYIILSNKILRFLTFFIETWSNGAENVERQGDEEIDRARGGIISKSLSGFVNLFAFVIRLVFRHSIHPAGIPPGWRWRRAASQPYIKIQDDPKIIFASSFTSAVWRNVVSLQ